MAVRFSIVVEFLVFAACAPALLLAQSVTNAGTFIDPTQHPGFDDRRLDQADEVVWDRNLRDAAVDHVRERPVVVVEVVTRNARAYFELAPELNEGAERVDGRSLGVRDATFWLVWPLVVLGVVGAVRGRRHLLVVLAATVGGYFTLASLVFVAPPRLRAPAELMLVICAASLLAVRSPSSCVPSGEPARPGDAATGTLR